MATTFETIGAPSSFNVNNYMMVSPKMNKRNSNNLGQQCCKNKRHFSINH